MPRPLSRWFMNQQEANAQEDPYTRNTSPRTRPTPAQRSTSQQQQSQSQQRTRRRPLSMATTIFTLAPGRARPSFPAVFNIVRFSIYAAVLAWTVICLAIAAHFNGLLQSSDLTSFIPLAIFVSVASLIIFLVLLGFTIWKKDANPISARIELGCLGLAGTLWIALGALMASSGADLAEVECFASEDETEPAELPGFTTETFRAQYRVLEAFALFNAILIWAFFLFLLFLILRRRSQGNSHVWFQPVTELPWADAAGKDVEGKLPAPVTARTRSRSRPAVPEKDLGASAKSTPATTPGSTPRGGEHGVLWMPHIPNSPAAGAAAGNAAAAASYGYGGSARAPPRAYPGSYDRHARAPSPQRQDSQRSQGSSMQRGRSADKWGRDASPRRGDSQRSAERPYAIGAQTQAQRGRSLPRRDTSQPGRQDSQRSQPARQDSQRSQPARQDSQRSQPTRQNSRTRPPRDDSRTRAICEGSTSRPARDDSRTRPARDDSRTRMAREDSQRSQPRRDDSQRSRPARGDSQRTAVSVPKRDDSQRSRPARGDSQRTAVSVPRRDDSQRSRPARGDSQRTAASVPRRDDSQRSAGAAAGGRYRDPAARPRA